MPNHFTVFLAILQNTWHTVTVQEVKGSAHSFSLPTQCPGTALCTGMMSGGSRQEAKDQLSFQAPFLSEVTVTRF